MIAAQTSLHHVLAAAAKAAERHGTWALLGFSEDVGAVDPRAVFAAAGAVRTFWRPPDAPAMVTSGHWQGGGPETLPESLRRHPHIGTPPILTAAIPFDTERTGGPWTDFSFGLRLPRHVLRGRTLTSYAIVSGQSDLDALEDGMARERQALLAGREPRARAVGPAGSPHCQPFEPVVRRCLAALSARGLRKVVPARAVTIPGRWDADTVLRRLDDAAHCTVFATQWGANLCFLGATPEWLARVDGGTAQVSCLAGTASRGAAPEEDDALGRALLADGKNRREHTLVLEMIRAALCDLPVETAAEPELLRLPHLQHLSSPVRVRCGDILDLARRLHPTPAVAGLPVAAALDLLRAVEPFDRGGYGGLVGWVDMDGNGELAVAIRSALLTPDKAIAYAGCGVVPGSDPVAEARESRLKLRTILSALGLPYGP